VIDVILFDLFGVIAREQSAEGKQLLAATAGVPAPQFWVSYWALRPPYDRGEVAGPAYWRQVATALSTSFDDRRIADLIAADIASWSAVDDDMVALVDGLNAEGHRLALLSNIPEELAQHYEKQLDQFAVRAFSCRIGHAKPERAAYLWCCDALDVDPGRVLFVDDRAENVAAAEEVGMRGHLFTGLEPLRKALSEAVQPGMSWVDQS